MNDVARHTRLKRRGAMYWFKAKVPKDLQGRGSFVTGKGTPKTEVAFTLGTRDPEVAGRLVVDASARFNGECDRVRRELAAADLPQGAANGAPAEAGRPNLVSLSYRQCVALSGRWLREMLAVYEAHPENEEGNALGLELLADAVEAGMAEQQVAPFLDRMLSEEGITVGRPTRRLLVGEMVKAMTDHLRTAVRQDSGDFTPATELARYPAWEAPASVARPEPVKGSPAVTVKDVVDGWVRKLGITDKRINPNHSWRHRVSDQLLNALVPPSIKDAILGHEAGAGSSAQGSA